MFAAVFFVAVVFVHFASDVWAEADCSTLMDSLVQQTVDNGGYGSWDACCARSGVDCLLTRQQVPAGYEPCDSAHGARATCNSLPEGVICMIGSDGQITSSPCASSQIQTSCATSLSLGGTVITGIDIGTILSDGASAILNAGVLEDELCCSTSSCHLGGSCSSQYTMSCVSDGPNHVICMPLDQSDDSTYAVYISDDCMSSHTTQSSSGPGASQAEVSHSETNSAQPTPPANTKSPNLPTTTISEPITIQSSTSSTSSSGNDDQLALLWGCSPCGSEKCVFSDTIDSGAAIFSLIIGTPLSNCDGSTEPSDNTVSGTITISDTWSHGYSIGLNLGDLNINAVGGWSKTIEREVSQSLTLHVDPGQQGVLTASVQYKLTNGTMSVGSSLVSVTSNQPISVLNYQPEIVPCGTPFKANYTSNFTCSSSAPSLNKVSISGYVAALFLVILLTY